MARPTARVLSLLELLQSGGVRTVAELAGRLGVDERTVRRYADHLIDLDVPVESVRGRYGGDRLRSGYPMPPLMLSDDEGLAVILGLLAGRPAGRGARAGYRGPALDRRRSAPSPANLDPVHRPRWPAQRTHPAPIRVWVQ